jgi:hypothetical protein
MSDAGSRGATFARAPVAKGRGERGDEEIYLLYIKLKQ